MGYFCPPKYTPFIPHTPHHSQLLSGIPLLYCTMHSRPLYLAIKLTYFQKIECGELDAQIANTFWPTGICYDTLFLGLGEKSHSVDRRGCKYLFMYRRFL